MININLNIIQELKTLAVMDREPDTPQKLLDKALAAKIIMLTEDGRTMANNWGFYLFSKELDSEPQLRNNITVIMVSGLLDTVEAEKRVIDKYKLEAEEKGYSNMAIWCDRAKEWCIAAQDILSLFSKEEQLFIQDRRNKLVHGWLNKTHQERFNIQYFNGEKIVQEQVSKEEYNDIIKIPMLGVRDGNMIFQKELDDILSEFSKKFINPKLDYWNIVNKLNSDGFMDSVYMQIYSDIGVNWVPGLNLIPSVIEN